MSTIDLFKNTDEASPGGIQGQGTGEIVESKEHITEYSEKENKFVPNIDYSKFENFVFYGLAEEYYKNTFERIYRTYPYDGSKTEKIDWREKNSPFDSYVLENVYPKRTGYISLGSSSWSPNASSTSTYFSKTYHSSSHPSFVTFQGGPGLGDAEEGDISGDFDEANVYDTASNRGSSLKFDLKGAGNTVEFWFKSGPDSPHTASAVFDLWNSSSIGENSYGRFTIEALETGSSFLVTAQSGSEKVSQLQLSSSAVDFSQWKQYSIRTHYNTSSSEVESDLFVEGNLQDTSTSGASDFSQVTGALQASVGAFITKPSGSSMGKGWASVSGSIDEFRYWKGRRDSREISREWFTNTHGGTNTDDANTDLGVYYKFNEGITGKDGTDSNVLDYSGRVTNGNWINYSDTGVRSTGSAIEESKLNASIGPETKDPIIYNFHPDVSSSKDTKMEEGEIYDIRNNTSLYHNLPSWIIGQDDKGALRRLTQIMGSYLDNLQVQIQELRKIKDKFYNNNQSEPLPFAEELIESKGLIAPDIFPSAEVIESIGQRTEDKEFDESLPNIRSNIYHNIYNNLEKILKTKGTEESFRNLIRCFGIDRDIVDLKLYGDNSIIEVKEKYVEDSLEKNFLSFHHPDRFTGSLFQDTHPDFSNSKTYINYDSSNNELKYQPFTFEVGAFIPEKLQEKHEDYFNTPFSSASIAGFHLVNSTNQGSIKWVDSASTDDDVNMQIYAVRANDNYGQPKDAKFVLESSGSAPISRVQSPVFHDVYDNEDWRLGVSIKPDNSHGGIASGAADPSYKLEFEGYSAVGDDIEKSFYETASLTSAEGQPYVTSSKRVYAGAHKRDFTGSILQKSDVEIGDVLYWADDVSSDVLKEHAINPGLVGQENVLQHSQHNPLDSKTKIPSIQLLALHWQFDNLSKTDSSGELSVVDFSSGSQDTFGFLSTATTELHTGRATSLPPNNSTSLNKRFLPVHEKQSVNYKNNENVTIEQVNAEKYSERADIEGLLASVEKSLYDTVSKEMLEWFGTVEEFSNLIGDPAEKYRIRYKSLEKLRNLFFRSVDNKPDVNKYVEYYRWFDSALSKLIKQIMPASAGIHREVENVIESHDFERNKYRHKYPSLEFDTPDLEDAARGINEMLFDKEHAFISQSAGDMSGSDRKWHNLLVRSSSAERAPIVGLVTESLRRELDDPIHLGARNEPHASQSISPASVEYVKMESGSIGNFVKWYENVHTVGAKENPRYLVENTAEFDKHRFPENPMVSGSGAVRNDKLPDRNSLENDTVFRNRFGAPGDEYTLSRGYLDPESEEYSIYAQINYRHLDQREGLNSESAESFFFDKIKEGDADRSTVAGNTGTLFHKTHRNQKLQISGSSKWDRDVSRDNDFVRRQIPRVEIRYKWIDDSFHEYQTGSLLFTSFDLPHSFATGSDRVPFLSQSEDSDFAFLADFAGSPTGKVDFLGLNRTYYSPLLTGSLTFQTESSEDTDTIYEHNLSVIGGPYNFPTWKQIRVSENIDYLRKNNIISSEIGDNIEGADSINKLERKATTVREPPVSKEMSNLQLFTSGSPPRIARVPFLVNRSFFDNDELQDSYQPSQRRPEGYDQFRSSYDSESFAGLVYQRRIHPRGQNTHFGRTRGREEFTNQDFWKEKRTNRTIDITDNSQNSTIVSHSRWPLDSTDNFGSTPAYDGKDIQKEASGNISARGSENNKPGELQNNYSIFNHAYRYNRANIYLSADDNVDSGGPNDIAYNDSITPSDFEKQAELVQFWVLPTDHNKNFNKHGILALEDGNTACFLNELDAGGVAGVTTWRLNYMRKWDRRNGNWITDDRPIRQNDWNLVTIYYDHSGSNTSATPDMYVSNRTSPGLAKENINTDVPPDGLIQIESPGVANILGFTPSDPDVLHDELNSNILLKDVAIYESDQTIDAATIHSESWNNGSISSFSGSDSTFFHRNRTDTGSLVSFYRMGNVAEDDYNQIRDEKSDYDLTLRWDSSGSNISDIKKSRGAQKAAKVRRSDGIVNAITPFAGGGLFGFEVETLTGSSKYGNDEPVYEGQTYFRNFKFKHSSASIYFPGESEWTLETENKKPFYNDYPKYSEAISAKSKNKTVLPEFRISEHIDEYIQDESGNFLSNNIDGLFTLTGSVKSDSSEEEFYDQYAFSDILDDVNILRDDHKEFAEIDKLVLKFEANKKLLPYQGFYPADRCKDLGSLLSQSYGDAVKISGSDPTFQTFLRAFYAPGIMYNSIKSGIGIDYPVHSENPANIAEAPAFLESGSVKEGEYCYDIGEGGWTSDPEYTFDKRLPFESILKPEKYISDLTLAHDEVEPYSILDSKVTLDDRPDPLYSLAANNFAANVVDFFLQDSALSSVISAPEVNFNDERKGFKFREEDVGKSFGMDIVLRNSEINSYHLLAQELRDGTQGPGTENYSVQDRTTSSRPLRNYININTVMFDKHEGFGIPSEQTSFLNNTVDSDFNELDAATYAAFTPPYYDGFSRTRVIFEPEEAGVYSVQEIQNSASYHSVRTLEDSHMVTTPLDYNKKWGGATNDNTASFSDTSYTEQGSGDNHMHLPSSINVDGTLSTAEGNRWSIYPKFESPVLNFKDVTPSQPPSNQGSSSAPAGMWLQEGNQLSSSEGIEFGVFDIPSKEHDSTVSGSSKYAPNLQRSAEGSVIITTPPQNGDKVVISGGIYKPVEFKFQTGSLQDFGDFQGSWERFYDDKYGSDPSSPPDTVSTVPVPFNVGNSTRADAAQDFAEAIENQPWLEITVDNITDNKVGLKSSNSRADANNDIRVTTGSERITARGLKGGGKPKDVESLRQKLGFPNDSLNIGEVKREAGIREAIIAVPFTEKDGERHLFDVPKDDIEENNKKIVRRMRKTLEKYNVPPRMNFIEFDEIDPFLFMSVEMGLTLDRNDLFDIWQNRYTVDSDEFGVEQKSVEYNFSDNDYITRDDITDGLRWLVFKAKERGERKYADVVRSSARRRELSKTFVDLQEGSKFYSSKYSYNWPYDYCSVVETADLKAAIKME